MTRLGLSAALSEPSGDPLRVLVADDDDQFRRLILRLLELVPNLEIIGEAVDGTQAVRLAQSTTADVALLDVDKPHLDGLLTRSPPSLSRSPTAPTACRTASTRSPRSSNSPQHPPNRYRPPPSRHQPPPRRS